MAHSHIDAYLRLARRKASAALPAGGRRIAAGTTVDLDRTVTPFRAWALILPAFLCFSLLDASAKWLVLAGFAPLFVVWCRYATHAIIILVLLRVWERPERLRTAHPWQQAGRGLLLAASTLCNFLALQTMQLAETMAIYLASPMVVTALSGPLLGEWAGWRRWLATIVGFVGVLVVVRPGSDAFQWPVLYSIAALLSATLYFVATRAMTATETDESMIVYSGVVPAVLFLPVPFVWGTWPGFSFELLLLCSLGLYGSVGHLLAIKAHREAPAPAIAPAVFSQIIWMTALGWLVFAQVPDRWTALGCAVIIGAGLYILQRERYLAREAELEPVDEARMRD